LLVPSGTSLETLQAAILDSLPSGERIPTSVEIPFAEQTVQVLKSAEQEADRLEHSRIGHSHLLLGLLRVEESAAASLLRAHGVELAAATERAIEDYPSDAASPRISSSRSNADDPPGH
jgi:ATP-dependent Clp protease ATP-binding subunit ClpC